MATKKTNTAKTENVDPVLAQIQIIENAIDVLRSDYASLLSMHEKNTLYAIYCSTAAVERSYVNRSHENNT